MIKVILEIDTGGSDPRSPLQLVEQEVLSPKLRRLEEDPKSGPVHYKNTEWPRIQIQASLTQV